MREGMIALVGALALLAAAPTSTVGVVVTDHGCALSRTIVPPGTVAFRVVNRGTVRHRFTVAARSTPSLAPGRRATLTVRFAAVGAVAYHFGADGVLVVDRPTVPQPPAAGPGGTVTVTMFEYGFTFSPAAIPAGRVTFVMENVGTQPHEFELVTVARGPFLDPGETATETVELRAGRTYTYVDEVPDDWAEGMEGTFTPVG